MPPLSFIRYFEGTPSRKVRRFEIEVLIMQTFGWDYYTLLKQPNWWIENFVNYYNYRQEVEAKKNGQQ